MAGVYNNRYNGGNVIGGTSPAHMRSIVCIVCVEDSFLYLACQLHPSPLF